MEKEINLTLKKKMICVWHLIINLPFFWQLDVTKELKTFFLFLTSGKSIYQLNINFFYSLKKQSQTISFSSFFKEQP
jgi:hypothetical protein